MKHRYLRIAVVLGAVMCFFSGCNNKSVIPLSSLEEEAQKVFDYDVSDYVKLGDYKKLSVQYPLPSVSSEDVDVYVMELLDEYTEYNEVNRAVMNGDYVNIDFAGTIDGEEFDGGSEEGYELTLGNGEFIDEFENNLIGMKAGESKKFKVTFPDNYDEEFAGQEAEFDVTVNTVSEVIVPEYNDAFIAEATEYDSVSAYEASVEEELMISAQEESLANSGNDALAKAVENAKIKGYPQAFYDDCYNDTLESYQAYAEMFGMEFEDFMNDFMGGSGIDEEVLTYVNETLVCQAILEKEGLVITDKEYQTAVEELALAEEYDNADDYIADYGSVYVMSTVLRDKAVNFLYENAVVEEVSADEYYSDDEFLTEGTEE